MRRFALIFRAVAMAFGVLLLGPAIMLAQPTQFAERLQLPEARKIVQIMVDKKLAAMKAKDEKSYLSLLGSEEGEYLIEQRNWFLIFKDAPIKDYAIEIQDIKILDQDTILARIRDTYLYGAETQEPRDSIYEKIFKRSAGDWKDCDLFFEKLETEHFIVKFPKQAIRVASLMADDAEKAFTSVTLQLGLHPRDKTVVKLYTSREMLRHSSDISVEWLFTGWYEYGESIKLFAFPKAQRYSAAIAHELTHKICSGISDSMALWLAEGMAKSYGSYPFEGGTPLERKVFKASDISRSLNWLTETNLWTLHEDEVDRFYAMSGMVLEFLRKTYGQKKLLSLLHELGKNPRYSRGYDPKTMEDKNQRRTLFAIKKVYGLSWESLDHAWRDWIVKQS